MLWTVLSPLWIIMHKRERRWQKRRNNHDLVTMLLTLPPTTLITGMSHNSQGFIWGLVSNTGLCESYIGTLQPELHLQARNLLMIAGGGSLEAVLRLARECTCFWILKIHGKLLVAEKWGFGNIKLYLKLIVMNSCTIFKGLCKWFPYTGQTSCELGKVTTQTMWKS